MKNQLLFSLGKYAFVMSLCIIPVMCQNPLEKYTPEDLYGKINIRLNVRMDIKEAGERLAAVATDDFVVDVRLPSGDLYETYDRFADLSTGIPLAPGSYYIDAHSPGLPDAGFDKSYYYGESGLFSIDYEEQKDISVTAILANCMVTISYSQQVVDLFADYHTTVSTAASSIVYSSTETRAGYFPLEELSIETILSYQNSDGTMETKILNGMIADPKPQTHYEVHIDAGLNDGNVPLAIHVEESLYTEVVEISDTMVEGPVMYGDLIITEIMYDPASLSDTEGEWFEIYNTTGQPIDLFHLVVKKGTDIAFIVNDSLIINPSEHFVLAKTETATANAGYIYGGALSLTNSGDHLVIANYGISGSTGSIIASVNYGNPGFPDPSGATISLNPQAYDADLARVGSNWCIAISAYETGDLGTPGMLNDPCQ